MFQRKLHPTLGLFIFLALSSLSILSAPRVCLGKETKRVKVNCQKLQHYWNASKYRTLNAKQLKSLSWSELELIRNGIYARHYMPFDPIRLKFFFTPRRFSWYRAWKTWRKDNISQMERNNIYKIRHFERIPRTIRKKQRDLARYHVVYGCEKVYASKKKRKKRLWSRWKPTPFQVVVHCKELKRDLRQLAKSYASASTKLRLKRKGWLYLALLRNGLAIRSGYTVRTPWMARFFRILGTRSNKRSNNHSALMSNIVFLSKLEKRIGSMRLSMKDYNLKVFCAGAMASQKLTKRQQVVLLTLSFLGTKRFNYTKKVRSLQSRYKYFSKKKSKQKLIPRRQLLTRYDCSGLIESVFQGLNINLSKPAPWGQKYSRYWNTNGVKILLYNLTHRYGGRCKKRKARLGDIIFFDYCWDVNGNGRSSDDPLTHVGIVTGIYPDGTVEFVHNAGQGMRRRIEIGRMNLREPNSRTKNKPSKMCNRRSPAKIFRCYGFPAPEKNYKAKKAVPYGRPKYTRSRNSARSKNSRVSITLLGDIRLDQAVLNANRLKRNQFNFDAMLSPIKASVRRSDITIANLETAFSYRKNNRLASNAMVSALKKIGVDVVTTAGGYALKQGKQTSQTLRSLRRHRMRYLGSYLSRKSQRRNRVLFVQKKGIKIAFLNYSTHKKRSNSSKKEVWVNQVNRKRISSDIRYAKRKKADVVIVLFRFANNKSKKPSRMQRSLTHFTFKAGADVVLGGQPQSVQPYYTRRISDNYKETKERLILYSAGSFVTSQRSQHRRGGILLHFEIVKKRLKRRSRRGSRSKLSKPFSISFKRIRHETVWMYSQRKRGKKQLFVLPAKKHLARSGVLKSRSSKRAIRQFYERIEQTIRSGQSKVKSARAGRYFRRDRRSN